MEKIKLLIWTDYWKKRSGYAKEIRDLMPFFLERYSVAHVGLGYNGFPMDDEVRTYATDIKTVKNYWADEVLHYAIDDFSPDIVLTSNDYFPLKQIAFTMAHPHKHRWIHYGLMDGEGLDFEATDAVRWADQHVYRTEFARQEMLKVYPQLDGHVIMPAVNQENFYKIEDKELKAKYRLDGKDVLVCVARPQLRKNLPCLLEAFKIVLKTNPNTVLILAATHEPKDFDGAYTAHDVERFVHKFGLDDSVIIPRNKDNTPVEDDVINLQYNLADINVNSSFGEGFNLTVGEAAMSGVPTIGPKFAGHLDSIGDRGIMVEPVARIYSASGVSQAVIRPEDLASKITMLLNDKVLREELGKKAYEFYKKLTPEYTANQFDKVFNEVLSSKNKPLALRYGKAIS